MNKMYEIKIKNKMSSDRVNRPDSSLSHKHANTMTSETENQQSNEYNQLLLRPEWRRKREVIITRDGNRCVNCGSANNLQVHHRQYHRLIGTGSYKKPWNYKDQYLITLCLDCHKAGHKYFKVPVFNV